MITIMECTDCKNCADFDFGYRIYCLAQELPMDEVFNYAPLGDDSADECKYFEEYMSHHFKIKDLIDAEQYSIQKYGEVTYNGLREFCLDKIK